MKNKIYVVNSGSGSSLRANGAWLHESGERKLSILSLAKTVV